MDTHFQKELDELRQEVSPMASRAETAVSQSVQSLGNRDRDLAGLVCGSDKIIDLLEVEIDRKVILLLTKAPLANDLRRVTVAMKVSQNLERIGDRATNIAERARDLAQEPALTVNFEINRMADITISMVKDALDAFARRDSTAARGIVSRDKEVDALNKNGHLLLVQHMTRSPETIGRCLSWIVVTKSLERIADHAKNIAGEVVYLFEAKDIRHRLKN